MASHGKKRHLKRLAAPKAQAIQRKAHLWLLKATPGPHAKTMSLPLMVLVRDMLKLVNSASEGRKLISMQQVFVDSRVVSNEHFPVGLMDVVSIPKLNTAFMLVNKKGKLVLVKVEKTDSKLSQITGKRLVSGGKTQLTLHDGRNILIEVSKGKEYRVGDSLRLSIPSQKILQHLPLQKGARCYVFQGRHAGSIGKLEDIIEFEGITRPNARISTPDGGEQLTLKEYVFVVDNDFKI